MAKSKTIRVTPNVMKCLEELRSALKTMRPGKPKKNAEGALKYLSRTFKGEAQPGSGKICPPNSPIIR
jgi:hypothetical protein